MVVLGAAAVSHARGTPVWYIRQPRPGSGLGSQVNVTQIFQLPPLRLDVASVDNLWDRSGSPLSTFGPDLPWNLGKLTLKIPTLPTLGGDAQSSFLPNAEQLEHLKHPYL